MNSRPKLNMQNQHALTPNGHFRADITSWLQKAIRRGDEDAALYCARELDQYGVPGHVWRRLLVICSEDVAQTELLTKLRVRHLYEIWKEFSGNPDPLEPSPSPENSELRLYMIEAVLLLCRAQKSREVLHATNVIYLDRTRREIPDFALDMHTPTGRQMGRGMEHFLGEPAHLENRAAIPDPYKERAEELLLQQEAQQ